ncbi:MAG: hypothetical protein OHK0015_46860 [Chloroflexi bacterium OHK40]
MCSSPWRTMLTLLIALALLPHPLPLAARPALALTPQQTVRYSLFMPMLSTPHGPPAFAIASPGDGWTLAGTSLFGIAPTDLATISSVTFIAGATVLGTDSTPADGFRAFLDARALPAGPLTLSATARGPGGSTTRSVRVSVVHSPAQSGTVGAAGGTLASQIGSVITIPPGALPNGTQVSVVERSQQEITARTGFDWDAMGVTFLGAQEVTSSAPISQPLQISSAGFGQRVQPGQAVVTYRIMPDVDDDGVDEIVVVNTASVAPNNDVVSDPVLPAMVLGMQATPQGAAPAQTTPAIGGPPGTQIEFPVSGFNPFSSAGNLAEWTCADGRRITNRSVIAIRFGQQYFLTVIPNCVPGSALVLLRNLSTNAVVGPFSVLVAPPLPQSGVPGAGMLEALEEVEETIKNLPPELNPPTLPSDWREHSLGQIDEAQEKIERLQDSTDPETREALEDLDNLAPDSGGGSLPPSAPGASPPCLTKAERQRLLAERLKFDSMANEAQHNRLRENEDGRALAEHYGTLADLLGELLALPDCEEDGTAPPNKPDGNNGPQPNPGSETGEQNPEPGMGAAPVTGGNGYANVRVPANPPPTTTQAQAPRRMFVKVFSRGSSIAFTGLVDAGGYAFVPIIPQDEPFVAVAYDRASGETRTFRGIGPKPGWSVRMFFDFSRPEDATTARWDGGGDGTRWADPLNWEGDHLPTPAQNVLLDVPGDLTVIVDGYVQSQVRSLHANERLRVTGGNLTILQTSILTGSLTMTGGTLTADVSLTLNGGFTWQSGVLAGVGTTVVNGGLDLGGSFKILDRQRLENSGAVTLGGGLQLRNGAVFVNRVGASLTFSNDVSISLDGAGTLINAGSIVKSGGSGVSAINVAFTNSGTLRVQSGTLRLDGGGNNSGVITIDSGRLLDLDNAFVNEANGRIAGTGTLDLRSATFTNNGTVEATVVIVR